MAMRLTLRTLLAYLDDAIEPKEAQALSQKIEESDFATGLMQRLRGVTHKPRLPAPKIDGKGLGLDANTVAEYIESTLPPERVADFERLCIESDMHLAEVAATHQILTLVLGKPAEVSDGIRQRVYRIDPVEASKPRTDTATTDTQEIPAPKAPERKRWVEDAPHSTPVENEVATPQEVTKAPTPQEVPEYLRSGRETSSRWPRIIAVAAGFLITGVVLRAMGEFNAAHPLAQLFAAKPVVVDQGIPPLPEPPPAPPTTPMPPVAQPVVSPNEVERPVNVVEPPMPLNPVVPPLPNVPAPVEPAVAPVTPKPEVPQPDPVPPMPAVEPMPSLPLIPAKPRVNANVDVGRYISEEQVLTRFDEKSALWIRVPPKALLVSNERLVSLPIFRPMIALPSGVQMRLIGEAHFQMLPPGESTAPRIQLDQGRMTLITDGAQGGKVDLVLAGLEVLLTLNDPDSLVSIDVRPYLPPGSDPQRDEAWRVIEIFAVNGQVTLQQPEQRPLDIRPNHVAVFLNQEPAQVSGPFQVPDWIDLRNVKDIDRDAARNLEKAITGNRPLSISLAEMLQDRRVEVRSLAARSLAVLGAYDGLLSELGDQRQTSFWNAGIDTLHGILARNPDAAGNVRHALGRIFGEHGPVLYRILWGYSPEQLAGGGAADLVKGLESQYLEHRVLAANALEKIAGTSFSYRAAAKADTNKPAILKFRERAQDGQLNYKVAPSPKTEFKPLDGK